MSFFAVNALHLHQPAEPEPEPTEQYEVLDHPVDFEEEEEVRERIFLYFLTQSVLDLEGVTVVILALHG